MNKKSYFPISYYSIYIYIGLALIFVGCSMNNPFLPTDDKIPQVEKIILYNATIDIGDTLTLIPTILPDDAIDKSLTWSSDDEAHVTVDQNGKIIGITRYDDKAKYATITATAANGVTGTCRVYVTGDPKFELDDLDLLVGETKPLTLRCTTTKGDIKSTEWKISKPNIAKIASPATTGNVSTADITGLEVGKAIINVAIKLENDDSTYYANCTLTVTKIAEVESIILNDVTIDIGDTLSLIPTILPDDAVDKSLTWSSNDEAHVTVDQNGKITGITRYANKSEYATITATAANGVTGTCRVYVIGDPTFTINDVEIFMKETAQLELLCTTTKGNIASVHWSVGNSAIAALSNEAFSAKSATADVTGIKAGTTNVNVEIKLENDDSTYYANCTVVVKPKYTIVLTATEGASYSWAPTGETTQGITITVTEDSTFTCTIANPGGVYDTGNLITAGSFEFDPNNPITSEKNDLGDMIKYEYMHIRNGAQNPGDTTVNTNAANVKPLYFADLTAQEGTRYLVCDGGNSENARVWQARDIKNLKAGVPYEFSCFAANIDKQYTSHGPDSLAKLKFIIEYSGHTDTLLEFKVPEQVGVWQEYRAEFTPPEDLGWCHIYIVNYTTSNAGNDFAIDNIYFGTVQNMEATEVVETFSIDVSQDPPVLLRDGVPTGITLL